MECVFAQFTASRLNLPPRLAATIEVESALNDPMAMVLTLAGLDGAWRFIDAAFVVVLPKSQPTNSGPDRFLFDALNSAAELPLPFPLA